MSEYTKEQGTQDRQALVKNGYVILPSRGKVCRIWNWNRPQFVANELTDNAKHTAVDRVAKWHSLFQNMLSTCVRLDRGVATIDNDCDDEELAGFFWEAVERHAPEVVERAPARYGGGEHRVALFVRFDEADENWFGLGTHDYARPEAVAAWHAALATWNALPKDETRGIKPSIPVQRIEVFDGKPTDVGFCAKYFGVAGPHSYNDDGSVARHYRWGEGPTLLDTPLAQLPVITRAQLAAILDDFDKAAQAAGWAIAAKKHERSSTDSYVYDIDDDTRFDTNRAGIQLNYEQLCAAQAMHADLRCSSSFMEGRIGTDPERCKVGWSERYQCVCVYVFGDVETHVPKDRAPADTGKLSEALAEVIAEHTRNAEAPAKPGPKDFMNTKVEWLLATHAYFAAEDTVVEVHATNADCRLRPGAFKRLYAAWSVPLTKVRRQYATEVWEQVDERISVAGVRMRPDQPFPLYVEDGNTFKNIYRRPRHTTTGGDIRPFLTFMDRFLPDPVERAWLLDWLAHKQARPDIPGTAVLLVADGEDEVREGRFGTGRGLFFRILHKLYGEAYTRSQSFSVLSGRSSQSNFNDWLHNTILVTVDEMRSASPTEHRRGERSAVYEVLKDIVDPAPKRHRFNVKYGAPFDGMSYCSIMMASNHGDAAAIPEGDRRFTVLRNGRTMTREEAEAIVAWMANPANIGALSAALAARDLSQFSMFAPLATEAKTDMALAARSDVEVLLRDWMADPEKGLVFIKTHFDKHVSDVMRDAPGTYWQGELREAWGRFCVGLKTPSGEERRVRVVSGGQRQLFCFRTKKRAADALPAAAARREAAKWGFLDPQPPLAALSPLSEKDE